jgi:integrase/recombinase XerD
VTLITPVLEAYFVTRLAQRQASPHTISSYRDTFCLLARFAEQRLGKPPSRLEFTDLDASFVGAFLDHLETERGNCASTRNVRLAAVHSLFSYAGLRCPEHAALIGRVLAIPPKRADTTLVCFLTRAQVETLLDSPDRATWLGRRDHVLLGVAVQTGLRVSEPGGLNRSDVELGASASVQCCGKGRKERRTPLTRPTARLVRDWLAERHGEPTDPLFPTRSGGRLGTDAVADLLAKHVAAAAGRCPSLKTKRVTPHTLETHGRDDAPARGSRHLDDRAVARPRRDKSDPDLPARRSDAQRGGTFPHRTASSPTSPIPPVRRPARLPRAPVVMPACSLTPPPLT